MTMTIRREIDALVDTLTAAAWKARNEHREWLDYKTKSWDSRTLDRKCEEFAATRAILAELQSAGCLIPAGGMALTAERIAELIADAPAANYEENDYNAGYVAALINLRDALFPAAEPSDPVVPKPEHPYFVWEQGYQAAVTDSDAGVDGTRGNAYTSNPYSLGESEPDLAAEPAVEETKAEGPQDVEVMQWDGTRKSIQAICDWVNSFDDELDDPTISYCFSSAAPDDVLDVSLTTNEGDFVGVSDGDFIVRDTQGNFYRRDRNAYATVEASSPVVPAPNETGQWEDISEAPKHLTLIDRVGDKWTYDGDNWVTPETAILPVLYINRKYAPFVAVEEG